MPSLGEIIDVAWAKAFSLSENSSKFHFISCYCCGWILLWRCMCYWICMKWKWHVWI